MYGHDSHEYRVVFPLIEAPASIRTIVSDAPTSIRDPASN